MEGNEDKTMEMQQFVNDFELFYDKIVEKVKEMDDEHIVTLFAIYLKNGRTEAMNGNGYQRKPKSDPNAPATDRQRELIRKLVEKGRVKFE